MSIHKLICYCRVSTAKQDRDGESLVNQQLLGSEYAKSKNMEVITFSEQRSGSLPPQHRPILSQALQSLQTGDVFFVKSRDRLSRDPVITNYIIGIITLEKQALIVCGDDDESQDFITRLCHNFISDISAHQYRESISKKTIAIIEMRKRDLKQWSTYVPYGFVSDSKGNLLVSLKQQEVLEDISRMKSLKMKAGMIAKSLNDRSIARPKYVPKSRGSWHRNDIERLVDHSDLKRRIIVKYGDRGIVDVDVSVTKINTIDV